MLLVKLDHHFPQFFGGENNPSMFEKTTKQMKIWVPKRKKIIQVKQLGPPLRSGQKTPHLKPYALCQRDPNDHETKATDS